jgi:hypothetical protein
MVATILITYGAIVLGFVLIPGPATLVTVMRAMSSGAKVGIATGRANEFPEPVFSSDLDRHVKGAIEPACRRTMSSTDPRT